MSTSISDLTSYHPWFTQVSGDDSAGSTSEPEDGTGGSPVAATGSVTGDSSSQLNHLTDVMQSILAQYQEAAGTKATDSAPPNDHSATAAMPNDEMLTELIADLNSELSTLEAGSVTAEAVPVSAETTAHSTITTDDSTARLAQALSNMAMLMLQSYNAGAPAAGASVSMTG